MKFPKPRARVLEREDARKTQDRLDNQMRCEVRERDSWRCRVCGVPVSVGAILPAKRAEVHHIVSRSLAPTRVRDVSNLVTVCGLCHVKLTGHELEIVGTNQARMHVKRGPNFHTGR